MVIRNQNPKKEDIIKKQMKEVECIDGNQK